MDNLQKFIGAGILVVVIGAGIHTFFKKSKEDAIITYSTSDARDLKGEISIALDSWIGYFPFKSPVFGQLMRDEGYRVKVIDDNADYAGRMEELKKGRIDFAVCTVDSYLLNGGAVKFPGVIVSVIDESKGGDAIVAWKESIPNIESLKSAASYRVAFTPASPSEHLLKAIAVHFDIPMLKNRDGAWRIETGGSQEALALLTSKKTECAVLWEPDVTDSLSDKNIVKLIGSEDMQNLIVDILLVNRKYADTNPEQTKIFIKNYHRTMEIYTASRERLSKDIISHLEISEARVKSMLKGVRWMGMQENLSWFGTGSEKSLEQPGIVRSINSTIKILTENKDFDSNPLPDRDPYTILNSSFIKELGGGGSVNASMPETSPGSVKTFSSLSDDEWKKLRVIGSFKLLPVTFRSGTSEVDENGRDRIRELSENMAHYPNYRFMIKGHSGLLGDPEENRRLSSERAASVKNELTRTFRIDTLRMKAVGAGASEPLKREDDESERAYNNRLKRVELYLLAD
jgi:outer membrane protein OmpA-like peptidoglycan-associated protein/intracellular sulfur oxidation DsrE/DsrF family protein